MDLELVLDSLKNSTLLLAAGIGGVSGIIAGLVDQNNGLLNHKYFPIAVSAVEGAVTARTAPGVIGNCGAAGAGFVAGYCVGSKIKQGFQQVRYDNSGQK